MPEKIATETIDSVFKVATSGIKDKSTQGKTIRKMAHIIQNPYVSAVKNFRKHDPGNPFKEECSLAMVGGDIRIWYHVGEPGMTSNTTVRWLKVELSRGDFYAGKGRRMERIFPTWNERQQ